MELNLFDSLLSRADQLALSAVSWPHLGHVNLKNSGIFDRPCALFLKKWLNTICDSVKIVIIDLSSCPTDFLTFYYVLKWLNDTRVKYVRSAMALGKLPYDTFLEYHSSLARNIWASYDDFINCKLIAPDKTIWMRALGVSMPSRNVSCLLQNILNIPNDYYCTSDAPRTRVALPECPMQQVRVKIVMSKGRKSGRANVQIFTRESSY